VLQVLSAILIADLGITLVHLASHKIGVLWRFHAVHHSITRFSGLNGLMKHPLHQTVEMTASALAR
jgi:sterol desaturase/sphingolipid hydroxylase (fatty acid hydroxylase superfamily)